MNQNTHTNIDQKKTRLAYSGVCNDQITVRLIEIFSQNQNLNLSRTTQKRIPFLIAECFQNIIRHGANPLKSEGIGQNECFEVELSDQFLNIISTNLVANDEVANLIEQLNTINNSSEEELKAMRFEIISTGTLSAKGGAGLGLIELARKSENNILFDVKQINENYSTFTFDIKMDLYRRKSNPRVKSNSPRKSGCLKDTILYYKGKLGQRIKHHIQHILAENFQNIEENTSFKWLEDVTSIFGDNKTKFQLGKNNRIELIFKKINDNLDFEANKKFILDQVEQVNSIVKNLNISGDFRMNTIDQSNSLASLKLKT